MALGFNKINFWPRPKDQNHDVLIRTVATLPGIAQASAVAVFDGKLYVAGQNTAGPNNAPQLYEWDQAQGTLTAIAMPAAIAAVGANTQITGMVVYANQLWIVTGASANAADNGLIFGLSTAGAWVNAVAALGFPGWTGGAVANMTPRAFLTGGDLTFAAVPGVGNLEFHLYDGAAWTLENDVAVTDIDSPSPVELSNTLYYSINNTIRERTAPGVFAATYAFDGAAGDVTGGLAVANNQLWAAQEAGLVLTNPPTLAQLTPAASQKVRTLRTGILSMTSLSAGTNVENEDKDLLIATTTDRGTGLYNAAYPNIPRSEIVLIENGLSVRPLVELAGYANFMAQYQQYLYIVEGLPPGWESSTELFNVRIRVLE